MHHMHLPSLRGVSHIAGATCAILAGLALMLSTDGLVSTAVCGIYVTALFMLFSVSATYHRFRTRPRLARHLRTADHSMIFLYAAATYTPFLVLGLDGWIRPASMITVWSMAIIGISIRVSRHNLPRWMSVAAYAGMGWVACIITPMMATRQLALVVAFVVLGCVWYAMGAAVYLARRPDPWPRHFGFHEVFHVFVILGAMSHYAAVFEFVRQIQS